MRKFLLSFTVVFSSLHAQNCSQLSIAHEYDIPADCKGVTMTMKHDNKGKPFLYVASKESGLKIYNVSGAPVLAKLIPASLLGSLDVMNLSQLDNYLYLALGNHFSQNQNFGFAIVDVSNPAEAAIVSVWKDDKLKGGAGTVECRGSYLYLGAMGNGLYVFDVTDKKKPTLLSKTIPDLKFPDSKFDAKKINARGIAIRNNLLYLCYDAGGMRIMDISDKKNIREVGRYSNPVMNGKPRAYNNAVIDDSLLYVTVDYCGMEVLNVADPGNIKQVAWWNPWHCQVSGWQWFKSDGHANEIDYDKRSKLIFMSTGKSDLDVVNVEDPKAPVLCKVYGGTDNNIGTWGVSIYDDKIYLSYICTFGIPFKSNWTGVKILSYKP